MLMTTATTIPMTDNQAISRDLRKAGLKVTLPRLNILEILERAEQHHLSAEDVYKALLLSLIHI